MIHIILIGYREQLILYQQLKDLQNGTIMCNSIQTGMSRNRVAHDSFITNKKQLYTNEKKENICD